MYIYDAINNRLTCHDHGQQLVELDQGDGFALVCPVMVSNPMAATNPNAHPTQRCPTGVSFPSRADYEAELSRRKAALDEEKRQAEIVEKEKKRLRGKS
jgi:hypothetical protein